VQNAAVGILLALWLRKQSLYPEADCSLRISV